MTIRAFWPQTPRPGNLGDVLTPWLVYQIAGDWPRWCGVGKPNSHLVIGSILKHAAPKVHVWGSGAISRSDRVDPQAIYHAVRGPHTRDVIRRQGIACPEIYGDPAILLPRFHNAPVEKTHRLGIVPHYVDHEPAVAAWGNIPGVRIINVLRKNPLDVVDEIRSCESIVGSSLHGLIVAAAYGVANAWIGCVGDNQLSGDGIKFADWYASVDQPNTECHRVTGRETLAQLEALTHAPPHPLTRADRRDAMQDRLLAACPFARRDPPLVISYYTPTYAEHAQRLMADCRRVGVPYRIEPAEDRGAWIDNCRYKGEFVWQALREAQRPVLWIDADGSLREFPELLALPQGQIDFRARRHSTRSERPWHVGSLWLNNTPGGRLLAGTWAEACRRGAGSDEQALTDTWRAWRHLVTSAPLPAEYCGLPGDGDQAGRAVIAHTLSGEASRYQREMARPPARAAA